MLKHDYKIGDMVRVLRNSNSNNYTIGETYEVIYASVNTGTTQTLKGKKLDGTVGNGLSSCDVELGMITVDYLTTRKKALISQIAKVDLQIEFMEANDLTEFDPMAVQVLQVLDVLDSTTSKLERAQKIVEILRTT